MKWSWKIAQVAGIGIYLHFTFLILLVWIAVEYYQPHQRIADALGGIFFACLIFAIVVLHELGHALAAKHYGINTRDITLYPIGGVARLERMPDDPKEELVVALAGPAVNVVLALLFFLLLVATGKSASWNGLAEFGSAMLAELMWVNIVLVLFNLLPAFPMDGGRVLRALLAMRMDYVRATRTAASIGQFMALLFGFVGLAVFYNPLLVFVALFVYMGAAQEASMVQMRSAIAGIPVRRAMITDFRTLAPPDRLSTAVDYLLSGFQQDFPVVDDGKVMGVLTRHDLLTAISQRGDAIPVASVMQQKFETAAPGESLESALARLQNCECRSLPVVDAGKLVGIITTDNLGEFLMVQGALHGERPA